MRITRRQLRQLITEQISNLLQSVGAAEDEFSEELAGVNLMGLDARGHDSVGKWIASKLGLENYWTFMQQVGLDVNEWVAEELAPQVLKKFIDNQMSGSDLLKINAAMVSMGHTGQFKGIYNRIISELIEDGHSEHSLTLKVLRATGATGRLASEIAKAITTRVSYM